MAAVEARRLESWDHTASIAAAIHNSQCADESKLINPIELHPLRARRSRPPPRGIVLDSTTIRLIHKGLTEEAARRS